MLAGPRPHRKFFKKRNSVEESTRLSRIHVRGSRVNASAEEGVERVVRGQIRHIDEQPSPTNEPQEGPV